jgi:hypothetical protein
MATGRNRISGRALQNRQDADIQPAFMEEPVVPSPEASRVANWQHGLRSDLTLGALPKKAAWIKRNVGRFRRHLERAVIEKHGQIDTMAGGWINLAVRSELCAQLANRWLKLESETLAVKDRLAVLATIQSATASRQRAMRELRLDDTPGDAWDTFYATPAVLPDEPTDTPHDAADATTEAQGGATNGREATSD